MERVQMAMLLLNSVVIILAVVSFHYFTRLMKLVKVRRGVILATSGVFLTIGYAFFIMPWIAIGESVDVIELFSYMLISIALIVLLYGVSRIYIDWREAIK
jgi:apolipoprotein N-acyltransferase